MENIPSENKIPRIDLPRPTLFAASGFVLLAVIGLWVCSLLALLMPGASLLTVSGVINVVYYSLFAVLPIALYAHRRPGVSESLRLNPVPLFPMIFILLLAVVTTFVTSSITALWSLLLDALGFTMDVGTFVPATRGELTASIIVIAAMPGVCEELLFRGAVMSAWETRGTKHAIVISAILFALMHGNIYGIPAYIVAGLLAGYLVFTLDSLYAGMIFHMVYNTACLVINYIVSAGSEATDAALAAAAEADLLTTLVALVVDIGVGCLMIAMTMFTLNLRRRIMGIEPIPRTRMPLAKSEWLMLALAVLPMIATIFIL